MLVQTLAPDVQIISLSETSGGALLRKAGGVSGRRCLMGMDEWDVNSTKRNNR
jgi:hypothetical protein